MPSIDLLFNIQTVQITPGLWDVTMLTQDGTDAAARMGGPSITLRLSGDYKSVIWKAKQFMIHNGIGS